MYLRTYVATYTNGLIASYVPVPTLNIHTPGTPTLLVLSMLTMLGVKDPGIVTKFTPSPALIPATASFPPNPPVPPELKAVVHCIPPSG